ncbi:MAG: hypothetical protein WCS01_04965 [bacterium]
MADVTITCATCGNQITVSEFVSSESILCMKCKATVPIPPREAPAPVSATLKLAMAPPTPPPAPVPDPPKQSWLRSRQRHQTSQAAKPASAFSELSRYLPSATRLAQRRRSSRAKSRIWPFVLFVLLTAILTWLRYWPGALPARDLPTLILWGIWGVVGLHIMVILYAFDDDPFHGVLCAIIPGYSLYYLFGHSDQFYLRAIAMALLIAFGWDTSLAVRKLGTEFYYGFSSWIQDTDTRKNALPH